MEPETLHPYTLNPKLKPTEGGEVQASIARNPRAQTASPEAGSPGQPVQVGQPSVIGVQAKLTRYYKGPKHVTIGILAVPK